MGLSTFHEVMARNPERMTVVMTLASPPLSYCFYFLPAWRHTSTSPQHSCWQRFIWINSPV